MIKILMVLGNTGRGGAQAYVMNVLRNIDRKRFQIDFAVNESKTDGYDEEIKKYGSRILYYPKFYVFNIYSFSKSWKKLLKSGKYDIVHGHASSTAAIYLRIAKQMGCATIAHSHSAGYRGNRFEVIVKKVFSKGVGEKADYWFACSNIAAERLFGKDYLKYNNYHMIPNAINTEAFLFDANKRKEIRERFSIGENDVIYGHVGTFSTPKNHSFMIQVFAELKKQDYLHKKKLMLVGDGALRNEISQLICQYGLSEDVILTGNVQNPYDYMMGMDCLIFPSLFEGFPVTLIEAQATGLYCVISDTITEEVDLTDLIVRLSLQAPLAKWVAALEDIPEHNRKAYNGIIRRSQFNMQTSIDYISALYDSMLERCKA